MKIRNGMLFLEKKLNMRNILFILIYFLYFPLSSQVIEDDFEGNGTIDEWVGDDCNLNSSYANPYIEGINTSSKVLKYDDIGGQYANVRFDTSQNLDLTTKTHLHLKFMCHLQALQVIKSIKFLLNFKMVRSLNLVYSK